MHYAKPFAYIIFFDSKAALVVGYFYIHLTDATPKAQKGEVDLLKVYS